VGTTASASGLFFPSLVEVGVERRRPFLFGIARVTRACAGERV